MHKPSEELIREVFANCAELSRRFNRPVSPDGHLVGSLGEIYAREQLGLELMGPSNEGFDARAPDGVPVEIKATTKNSISLSSNGTKSEMLVVVKFDETGQGRIVYNGPSAVAWELAGKPQKNGQQRLSLSRLIAETGLGGEGNS